MLVQALGPEAAIERIDEGIVCRLAGAREVDRDPALIGPEIHVARDGVNTTKTRSFLPVAICS
jgi:hypothetical protein